MLLKNSEIIGFAQRFDKAFKNETQYFPAKINFYIHKNIKTLLDAVEIIENARQDILKRYGKYEEDTQNFLFTEKNKEIANNELITLLSIQQDLDISTIKLSDLEGLNFTTDQMQTLFFMIEEDKK